MNKFNAAALLLFAAPWNLFAERVLPNAIPQRFYGLDQERSPSCQSESAAQAIEQVFANRGQRAMVSPWLLNYKFWYGKDLTVPKIRPLNSSDDAIVKASPNLVPDYMFPAGDFRGGWTGGKRPAISMMSNIDTTFPSDAAVGFQDDYRSFETQDSGAPWGNTSRNVQDIILNLKNNTAMTLSIHGELLYFFDHTTGLLLQKGAAGYSNQKLLDAIANPARSMALPDEDGIDISRYIEDARSAAKAEREIGPRLASDVPLYIQEINHSVAIIGYDADFYKDEFPANPGAIFVRNSWNDSNTISASESSSTATAKASDLERFKYPLYRAMSGSTGTPRNLVGYYALPIQYVQDLINFQWPNSPKLGARGYHVYRLNYDTFNSSYNSYMASYTVSKIPFVCGSARYSALNTIGNYLYYLDEEPASATALLAREARGVDSAFRLAQISVKNGDQTIIRRFLSGGFDDYYCQYSPESTTFDASWPGLHTIDDPDVWSAVTGVSSLPNSMLSWSKYLRTMHDKGAAKW